MHTRRATSILTVIFLAATLTPLAFTQFVSAATTQSFSDGLHQVGTDITPGTYVADIETGICTVRITSSSNEPTRTPTFISRAIITITDDDVTVETINCGEWQPHTKVGKKTLAQQFGEGTYEVGTDIVPGIYTASDSNGRCLWFAIKDFAHHTAPNQTLTWWKVGQPIVQLTDDNVGFYSIRCGTWQIRDSETVEQPLTEFGDGSYLVNIDIDPGNYITNSGDEECNWFRTAPFGDRSPDNTGGYVSKGRQIATILPTDTGFFSEGCGTWQPLSTLDLTTAPADVIDQGTFAVGIDIQPGAYVADAQLGRSCRWFHLSGFAGRASDIASSGTGILRGIVEIPADTVGFRSINCGRWTLIENVPEGSSRDNFGDGEHIVNVHLPPGIYTSPGPETGRCSWRRLSGFDGSVANHIAVRNPVGKNIAEISDTDAIFVTFGCGEWAPLDTDAVPLNMPSFGRGTWAVYIDIAPGTYAADVPLGSTCFWSRLSEFSGEPEAFAATQSGVGHSVATIRDFDAGFYSDGCGTWKVVFDDDGDDERDLLETFDDGVYVVHNDISSGTYIADGIEDEICYWSRLTGFDGDAFNRMNVYVSKGQAIATILDSDVGFRSFGCGTWRQMSEGVENDGIDGMSDSGSEATIFADGTYRVGIDVAPGIYIAADSTRSTCRWRRLRDFTWTSGVIVESLAYGIKIAEVGENDLGFTSSGCGRWEPVDLDTTSAEGPQLKRFGSGSYIVGLHIEPGTYYAVPIRNGGCRWRRVTGFGGTSSDAIAGGDSDNRWVVTIESTDVGFVTYGCGVWRSVDNALKLGPFDQFGDGSYRVNEDILPGSYVARVTTQPYVNGRPTPKCAWQRVSGFGQTADDVIEEYSGKGNIVVTISDEDSGFVSSGCGEWRRRD